MSERTASQENSARPNLALMKSQDEQALERILANIETLGLNDNLLDLETQGYTVIEGVLSEDRIERAKAAILRRMERVTGKVIDPNSATADDVRGMSYQGYLIFDDPVFPEILLEPKPLALITYLLGESCVLSSMGSHFRGPGGTPLAVHADCVSVGMSESSMVANCNYALTPYSREAGASVLVPGSHRLNRQPTLHENWMAGRDTIVDVMGKKPNPDELDGIEWTLPRGAVTLDINPGDAVVWHGNTWHAGWPRQLPGARINLAAYYCRQHLSTQERRGDTRYPEVFERYADEPRFAQLLGENIFNGWREEGPEARGNRPIPTGRYD